MLQQLLFYLTSCWPLSGPKFWHYIPAAGFQYRVPRTNKEWQWELIEVIDKPKARARRAHTAECGKRQARISSQKVYNITAAAKPQMPIPCVANSSTPCQRQLSQQAIHVIGANNRTTCTQKHRLRHNVKAAKARLLKAFCCKSRVVD